VTATLPGAIGAPVARIEGPEKVTGAARYAAEYPVDDLAYGWVVQSPVPRGRLQEVIADPAAEGDEVPSGWPLWRPCRLWSASTPV
jgi:xanthine dehydrogenase YagR molybdenum-binding subunit